MNPAVPPVKKLLPNGRIFHLSATHAQTQKQPDHGFVTNENGGEKTEMRCKIQSTSVLVPDI
jgi:hypothetical protein